MRLELRLGKVGEQSACLLHLLPLRHLLDAGVWLGGIVERGGSSFLCGNGALLGTADGRKNVGYQVVGLLVHRHNIGGLVRNAALRHDVGQQFQIGIESSQRCGADVQFLGCTFVNEVTHLLSEIGILSVVELLQTDSIDFLHKHSN